MRRFEDLAGCCRGPFVVIGLGPSRELALELLDLAPTRLGPGAFSIGCNEAQDVLDGRRTDFGLSFDCWIGPNSPFPQERLEALRRSRPASAYFHSMPETVPWREWEPFLCPVGYQGPKGFLDLALLRDGLLPNGWSSVVGAIAAAYWLGATKVAIAGLDLNDRNHDLSPHVAELGAILEAHARTYAAAGLAVVNLNRSSRITTLPFAGVRDFFFG